MNIHSEDTTKDADVMTAGLNEARAMILVSEYTALRAELMFFIQSQRQNMNFLLTTAFGQIAGLAFIGYDKVDPTLIVYFYLFAVPFLIGLLMLISLENTAKIVIVASYIAQSLRQQIRPFFDGEADYFLWERHKKDTKRVNRKLLVLLDRSKWFVFIVGLILSNCLAYIVQMNTHALKKGFIFAKPLEVPLGSVGSIVYFDQFIFGGLLVVSIMLMAFNAARYFSEAEGEEARRSLAAIALGNPTRDAAADRIPQSNVKPVANNTEPMLSGSVGDGRTGA